MSEVPHKHTASCVCCSIHVTSVVQMTHMLMSHGGVISSQALSEQQQLAMYFSALVHDFEHGGLNNDFLVCFPRWC